MSEDVDPIVVKGSHFFYRTNGTRFYVRGVVYEDRRRYLPNATTLADPLEDFPSCLRDIPFLVKLGVNTILVPGLRPGANHHQCMKLLQSVGIYVIVLLNDINAATDHATENLQITWGYTSYDTFEKLIDSFQGYTNTLGFTFLLADWSESMMGFVPMIKAAVRDAREYIKVKRYRSVPLGVIGQNHAERSIAQFMSCADDDSGLDFLALRLSDLSVRNPTLTHPESKTNCYNASMMQDQIIDIYKDYSAPLIPMYGCTVDTNHTFEELQFVSNNSDVFSGQVIETWSDNLVTGPEDESLVEISATNVQPRPLYSSLQSQLAKATPKPLEMGSYTPTILPSSCARYDYQDQLPVALLDKKKFATDLPSKPNRQLCSCMIQSLRCVANSSTPGEVAHARRKELCHQNPSWCRAIYNDPITGVSGSYSMCNATEKQSWVLDRYSSSVEGDRSACSSSGGKLQANSDINSHCRIFLDQAGPEGIGIVTHDLKDLQRAGAGGDGFGVAAKAGIVIGVICAVLFASGLIIWFHMRRKRHILEMDNGHNDDWEINNHRASGSGSQSGYSSSRPTGRTPEMYGDEIIEIHHDVSILDSPVTDNGRNEMAQHKANRGMMDIHIPLSDVQGRSR